MSQPDVGTGGGHSDRILSPTFVLMGATASLYWLAVMTTIPVLPRFIRDELGGGDFMVGAIIGSIAIGAIVSRPRLGRFGDRHGRRYLLIGGGVIGCSVMLGHLVVTAEAHLFALRILLGVGQASFMVGVTTMAVDLAPEARRGEAMAYMLVAMHLGIGSGPLLGEWLFHTWGFDVVWVVSAAAFASCVVLGLLLPVMASSESAASDGAWRFLHPAGLRPGVVLGVGTLGFIGYNAFVPLFGDEIGVSNVAPLFLISSATIIAIRVFGAQLPDRLGPVKGGSIALVLMATGLLVIGLSQAVAGLYAGTFVMALGSALLFPSLVGAAVAGVPFNERASAMATFTLFIDMSSAFGVVIFGAIAAGSSYSTAFVAGGLSTATAAVILRSSWFGGPRRMREQSSEEHLATKGTSDPPDQH